MTEQVWSLCYSQHYQALFRWRFIFLAVAALPCLAFLAARNPEDSGTFPPCPFLALTGYNCPGCGTLRGLHQLLNGNLLAAMDFNPLMVLSLPFLLYAFLTATLECTWGLRLPKMFVPSRLIWGLLAVVILFAVLRNLPVYPLSLLAP